MAQLVDTNVFIAIERRGDTPAALTSLGRDEPLAIASVTASELLFGVHRANTSERRTRRETFVEAILAAFPVLPFDLLAARTHARIWAYLATTGQLIGERDLMIAAIALTHGYDVLTDNVGEFARIPGLNVRRPTWP